MKKNVIIYGLGGVGRRVISYLEKTSVYNIVGVTKTNIDDNDTDFCGYKVRLFDELILNDFDYVIIASNKYQDEIRNEIENKVSEKKKIVTVAEFFKAALYSSNVEFFDNDLYRFVISDNHKFVDKWVHYYRIYERYLKKFRNTDVVFLEIGVFKGGSLQMWSNYFGKKATIIGVDIDESCKALETDNIVVEIGSQEDTNFWDYIKNKYDKIDVLIDDGGHTSRQQKVTFENMFPHISNGGIYICEDTHTSYMKNYVDTSKSFIEKSKEYIDDLHRGWGDNLTPNYNTKNIYSLSYYDSMMVVEKEDDGYIPFILSDDSEVIAMDFENYSH